MSRLFRAGTPARWGFSVALFAFLAATLLSALGIQIAVSITGHHAVNGQPMALAITAGGLLGLWTGLLGVVFFASRVAGTGHLSEDFGLRARWPFDLIVGLVAGAAVQEVLIPLLYLPWELADRTLKHRLEIPAKNDTAAIHGAAQIVAVFILLAVLAPLVEELFFRGLVQRSLAERFGPAAGVIGSAGLFGLAHFEPLQFPGLLLFGLVLGLLAQRTGRLGAGMVAHATFNAITVISLTVAR